MAEFAKSESAKAKEAIAKFATTKLKAIQNLFKMKKTIGCFSGVTLVHTTKGLQPIKNIKQGDKVYGTYINKNKFTTTNNFVLSTTRKIVFTLLILFLGSTSIETTPEHPFWVVEKGWTEAQDIREGDLVQTINNEQITIEHIEKRRGQFEVYNLDVADCDTFFVHELGVLVHNAENNPCGETRPKDGDLNKENQKGNEITILVHGTTLKRALSIKEKGPDLKFIEKGGQPGDFSDGFSTAPINSKLHMFGKPETYAKNKAKSFPNEGGPVLLKIYVPNWIVKKAQKMLGEVRFRRKDGYEELLANWTKIKKDIVEIEEDIPPLEIIDLNDE